MSERPSLKRQISSVEAAASIVRNGRGSAATTSQRQLVAEDLTHAAETLRWIERNRDLIQAVKERAGQ